MNLTSTGIQISHPDDAHIPVVRTDPLNPNSDLLHDQSVLAVLAAEHTDNWPYRGQLDRHYRPWPAEDKDNIQASSYMLDGLIPSDY